MLQTLWAEVKQGKIELLEPTELPEGIKVLVTLMPLGEAEKWIPSTSNSLISEATDAIWDNIENEGSISELAQTTLHPDRKKTEVP